MTKFIRLAFGCTNFLCWTVAKYLLINVQEENQEHVSGMLDDESNQWLGLENNETISLAARELTVDDMIPCIGPF